MSQHSYDIPPEIATDLATVAGAATAAIAHGLGPTQVLYITSSGAFNVRFGAAAVAAPADTASFPAGLHKFKIKKASQAYFRLMPNANGFITYYHGSQE